MQPEETQSHSLKAGAAQIDITPQPGIPLTGFLARIGASTGINDPLFARALALEADSQSMLLISCDLLALDAGFVAAARAAIQAATGIPGDHILIACTHTHSGPATIYLRDCGEVDRPYLDQLMKHLLQAARDAATNLQPARMGAGRGQVNPGALNRTTPGAAIDPDLDVLGFQTPAGNPVAILVNYACHPVCLDHTNRLISADYPGVLSRALQEQTGAVVLFFNGATGDINPEHMGDYAYAQELGQSLATETLRVLDKLTYQASSALRIVGETLDLPLLPLPKRAELNNEIATHRLALAQTGSTQNGIEVKMHRAMLGWAEALLAAVVCGNIPRVVSAELQAFCLGQAILVGVPAELFSQLGKAIKNSTATAQVSLLGYANDDIGYIPTRSAYARGGYEIDNAFKFYGYPAALAPEAGELISQCAVRLINQCADSVKNHPMVSSQ